MRQRAQVTGCVMVDGVKQPLQIPQDVAAQGGVGNQITVGGLAFFPGRYR